MADVRAGDVASRCEHYDPEHLSPMSGELERCMERERSCCHCRHWGGGECPIFQMYIRPRE